jgi:hypothetical protein
MKVMTVKGTTLLSIILKVRMKCKEYWITFQVASYLHTRVTTTNEVFPHLFWHLKSSK